MTDLIPLLPVKRPDGCLYQPRKIMAVLLADDIGDPASVLVLGTHLTADERVQALADSVARDYDGTYAAADPVQVWWRLSIEHGEPTWSDDPVRGRAAVWFRKLTQQEAPRG